MTQECITRIGNIIDSEMSKLVTHMEQSEPDRMDICMLKDLLKSYKLAHELSAMVK